MGRGRGESGGTGTHTYDQVDNLIRKYGNLSKAELDDLLDQVHLDMSNALGRGDREEFKRLQAQEKNILLGTSEAYREQERMEDVRAVRKKAEQEISELQKSGKVVPGYLNTIGEEGWDPGMVANYYKSAPRSRVLDNFPGVRIPNGASSGTIEKILLNYMEKRGYKTRFKGWFTPLDMR